MSKTINALKRAAATTRALDDGSADSLRLLVAEVAAFHAKYGYAPSFADLATGLGWSRIKTRDSVRALVESGHLTLGKGPTSRSIAHSLRVASDTERLAARASAWYAALRDLPAVEVAAARQALERLSPSTGAA